MKHFNISRGAVFSFAVTLLLFSILVGAAIVSRERNTALQTEQFILEKSHRIQDTLSKLFFKTEMLATLVRHGGGYIDDFDGIAALIVDDPAILNILIAPEGVVTNAFSLHDDVSALIGHDFFSESGGNIEAMMAVESGELVMAGPFISRQGYMVLAGRLPVFLDDGKTDFWGLVSVTLRFPEALDNADLGRLQTQGYEYELWRINPDNDERQVLDANITNPGGSARYLEKHIPFLNADWYLKLLATHAWYNYPEVIVLISAGIFISFLVLFIAQNHYRLKQTRAELAVLAKTDPLTGIFNRRHFAELTQMDIERVKRFNETAYIIILDIDHFKRVNDDHGHLVGDRVLIEIAGRIKEIIRPYDIFARFGGEEFIIYMPNSNREGVGAAVERLKANISDLPFCFTEDGLRITASFGVARVDTDGMEKTIKNADDALYQAKEEGRNRIVFHGASK
jgi:diguanylate cyclase (GGDEF)-like protein